MDRNILKLAIPNIISNITVPLLSLADTALLGHLSDEIFLAAIALGGVIFNFIYWSFGFLRMGTTGFTGQAYGAKRDKECSYILYRSISIALLCGVTILIASSIISDLSFSILSGSNQLKELAKSYFTIRVWAAPASISIFSLMGWFIGMQDSKSPLLIAVIINVINIVLNIYFVIFLDLGSDGVAYGTVLAQYSGLIAGAIIILVKYRDYVIKPLIKEVLNKSELLSFFKVNVNIFIRTLFIIAVFTFFTSKSASIDDTILAANSLLLQFLMFFSFFMDGIAYAGEALTAKFYGKGDIKRVKEVIKRIMYWSFILAILFTVIYYIFGDGMVKLLTSNIDVIEICDKYIFYTFLIPLLSFGAFIWDGVYVGLTASKEMRNSVILSFIFLFVPTYTLFSNSLGNHALWIAMLLFFFGRSIFQTYISYNHIYPNILNKDKL